MRTILSILITLLTCSLSIGQETDTKWYSTIKSHGVTIQNSFPKGGPYWGPAKNHFNHSYLVFFSRILNETDDTIKVEINFSSDSTLIPNATDTYVKLFLPTDTMTMEKQALFSYGITELESLEQSTCFECTVSPGEDCLFYSVAVFFQTNEGEFSRDRGGNRAEFILKGEDLYYNMSPQIEALQCGHIYFDQ